MRKNSNNDTVYTRQRHTDSHPTFQEEKYFNPLLLRAHTHSIYHGISQNNQYILLSRNKVPEKTPFKSDFKRFARSRYFPYLHKRDRAGDKQKLYAAARFFCARAGETHAIHDAPHIYIRHWLDPFLRAYTSSFHSALYIIHTYIYIYNPLGARYYILG